MATKSDKLEAARKEVSCILCSSLFSDPRLLPCLHVYCKCCLESLVPQNEAGTLTCPSCYKITDCAPSKLPRHLKMEREASLFQLKQFGEQLCGLCDDNNKAEAYCQNCVSPLCSDCVASHKRLKPFKSHSVVFSLDTELAKPQLPPISCPLHPKECFKYYCLICSSLICADCIVDHAHHNFVSVDEATSNEIKHLRDYIPKVERSKISVDHAINEISSIAKVVRENKKKSQDRLKKSFEEISAAIDSHYKQLSKELEDVSNAKTAQLEMQKEGLEKIYTSLEFALGMANDVSNDDYYSSIEVLSVKPSVLHALEDIFDHVNHTSFHPVCTNGPEISINHTSIEEFVSSTAKIHPMSQYSPLCSLINVNPKLVIGVARNCNCLLILQAKNSRGEDLVEGRAAVKANIKNKTTGRSFNCEVNDLQNGKYEIIFTSDSSFFRRSDNVGELHVTVDGTPIQNSPYAIAFINYSRIKQPYQTLITNNAPEYLDFSGNQFYVTTNQGHIEIYDYHQSDFKNPQELVRIKEIPKSQFGQNCHLLRGIAVDQNNGVMFIANAKSNEVIKADLNGNRVIAVGCRGTNQLEFKFPTGLCLTKEGLLLIGDCGNYRVQVLGPDLAFKQSIQCCAQVWSVATDPGDNIHVGTTSCVEVFDTKGVKITEYGQLKAGDIQFPNYQQPSDCKYSFVTECCKLGTIIFFNWKANTVLHRIDTISHPLGLRIDQSGYLSVCCFEDNKIQMFVWKSTVPTEEYSATTLV